MFLRIFQGIKTASSWELCPPARGRGGVDCAGAAWTAKGSHWTPRIFSIFLWECWLLQFDLRDRKPTTFDDQYADAKHHYHDANPKIAF